MDDLRCRYEDCRDRHPVAREDERVTCPRCRQYLGLPSVEQVDRVAGRPPTPTRPEPTRRDLYDALRQLKERWFLDCIVEPPCGDCTVCRAAALVSNPAPTPTIPPDHGCGIVGCITPGGPHARDDATYEAILASRAPVRT